MREAVVNVIHIETYLDCGILELKIASIRHQASNLLNALPVDERDRNALEETFQLAKLGRIGAEVQRTNVVLLQNSESGVLKAILLEPEIYMSVNA
jgi:hypothetical protein